MPTEDMFELDDVPFPVIGILEKKGGVFGIGLGYVCSILVGSLANLNTVVRADAVVLATTFSGAVGLFFGIYPATRAARLNPIDALRYE